MKIWEVNQKRDQNRRSNISFQETMNPKITRGRDMGYKEEGFTYLALVQLDRTEAQSYRNPKMTTIQKFLQAHELEILMELEWGNNWSKLIRDR